MKILAWMMKLRERFDKGQAENCGPIFSSPHSSKKRIPPIAYKISVDSRRNGYFYSLFLFFLFFDLLSGYRIRYWEGIAALITFCSLVSHRMKVLQYVWSNRYYSLTHQHVKYAGIDAFSGFPSDNVSMTHWIRSNCVSQITFSVIVRMLHIKLQGAKPRTCRKTPFYLQIGWVALPSHLYSERQTVVSQALLSKFSIVEQSLTDKPAVGFPPKIISCIIKVT